MFRAWHQEMLMMLSQIVTASESEKILYMVLSKNLEM